MGFRFDIRFFEEFKVIPPGIVFDKAWTTVVRTSTQARYSQAEGSEHRMVKRDGYRTRHNRSQRRSPPGVWQIYSEQALYDWILLCDLVMSNDLDFDIAPRLPSSTRTAIRVKPVVAAFESAVEYCPVVSTIHAHLETRRDILVRHRRGRATTAAVKVPLTILGVELG